MLPKGAKGKVRVYKVSVIVRGKSSEVWRIVKNGMEQAASDLNVNISFITLLEDNNVEEQKELIKREIMNGTDGILISPADYNSLSKIIEDFRKEIPIVLFESNIETKEKFTYISCDNYELGKKLANEVIRNGNTRSKIKILRSGFNISSEKEKYEGFIDEISLSKNTYEFIDLPKDEAEIYKSISEILKKEDTKVVVAFEPNILEIAGKLKKEYRAETAFYGIGSTSLIISLMEEKIINAIAMQNEFNLGYLGIKAMVSEIENEKINESKITSTTINTYNMYSEENQKILFPIIR
nr:substrate-binding domain-containing protein [Caproiciproducens sp. MSJ-32]